MGCHLLRLEDGLAVEASEVADSQVGWWIHRNEASEAREHTVGLCRVTAETGLHESGESRTEAGRWYLVGDGDVSSHSSGAVQADERIREILSVAGAGTKNVGGLREGVQGWFFWTMFIT